MNAEYHRRLRVDEYRTFDEYLRERIRRGLQAHHDHTEICKRYVQDLSATRSTRAIINKHIFNLRVDH